MNKKSKVMLTNYQLWPLKISNKIRKLRKLKLIGFLKLILLISKLDIQMFLILILNPSLKSERKSVPGVEHINLNFPIT
jgi:hypothetical protein